MKVNVKQGLRPGPRWIALATLFAWVLAFGVCMTDCAMGMSCRPTGNGSMSLCHDSQSAGSGDADCPSKGSFCLTIKGRSFETYPLVLNPPDGLALFQPALAWLIDTHVSSHVSVNPTRQGQERNWATMVEVHVGPAHLPHGPPARC